MSELVATQKTPDRLPSRGREMSPSILAQSEFFRCALEQTANRERTRPIKQGPYYADFRDIMTQTNCELEAIGSHLRPEHIVPTTYQSSDVIAQLARESSDVRFQLHGVSVRRLERLDRLAATKLTAELQGQEIPKGLLSVPDYVKQGDDWQHIDAVRGCSSACFRMIFSAITGWTPSEKIIATQLRARYDTALVDDTVYSNIYYSDAFQEICDRRIVEVEIIGADFNTIRFLIQQLRLRQPTMDAYCIVNIASKTASRNIWHTNILLEANGADVICHDPSSSVHGGAYKKEPYDEFAKRWATTYNRAQLFLVPQQLKSGPTTETYAS
jgi:hypothetical protein